MLSFEDWVVSTESLSFIKGFDKLPPELKERVTKAYDNFLYSFHDLEKTLKEGLPHDKSVEEKLQSLYDLFLLTTHLQSETNTHLANRIEQVHLQSAMGLSDLEMRLKKMERDFTNTLESLKVDLQRKGSQNSSSNASKSANSLGMWWKVWIGILAISIPFQYMEYKMKHSTSQQKV